MCTTTVGWVLATLGLRVTVLFVSAVKRAHRGLECVTTAGQSS